MKAPCEKWMGRVRIIARVSAGGRCFARVIQSVNHWELMGSRTAGEQEGGKCQICAFH